MFASQNLGKSYWITSQLRKYASQFAKCGARSCSLVGITSISSDRSKIMAKYKCLFFIKTAI